jgi:hypothetical protein
MSEEWSDDVLPGINPHPHSHAGWVRPLPRYRRGCEAADLVAQSPAVRERVAIPGSQSGEAGEGIPVPSVRFAPLEILKNVPAEI